MLCLKAEVVIEIEIKENMKLNLPSTGTNKKIQTLLLLALATSREGAKAGQSFRNCLGDLNYEGIIRYSTTNNAIISNYAGTFGCFNGDCSAFPNSFPSIDITFQCARVGLSTFCVTAGSSATELFGGVCGGILGDAPAIDASIAGVECPSPNVVANALKIGPTTETTFTWLCCDNSLASCNAPSKVTVTNGGTTTNCGYGYAGSSLMCFADNGGGTCAGGGSNVVPVDKKIVGSIYLGVSQIITSSNNNSCTLQVGGIELSNNLLSDNSISTATTSTSSSPTFSLSPPTVTVYASENNSNNTTTATTVPLGTLLLTTTATTFYYRRRGKKALEQLNTTGQLSQVIHPQQLKDSALEVIETRPLGQEAKNLGSEKEAKPLSSLLSENGQQYQAQIIQTPYGIPSSSKK